MRKHLKLAASAAILAMLWQTGAQAAVIDFNALTDPANTGIVDRGFTYTEDGFVLDNLANQGNLQFRSVHSDSGDFFTGSVSFYNDVQNGVTRLTKSGGLRAAVFVWCA